MDRSGGDPAPADCSRAFRGHPQPCACTSIIQSADPPHLKKPLSLCVGVSPPPHVLFNSHTSPFLTVTDEKYQTLVFFLVCFISCENLIRTILYFPECLRQGDERRFLSERH